MEKTFTLEQVKKLIVTTASVTALVVWCIAQYAIPKMMQSEAEKRMTSYAVPIIGSGEVRYFK